MNQFEVISRIERIETIAVWNSIRERDRLVSLYGQGRWRKLKGFAHVTLPDGKIERAEVTLVRSAWDW